ncbi:MAG: hypothetical protein JWP97_5736, partial [Labilithrix sp.]|nr:hypothetical protein [Labilithrix sp.]
GAPDPRFAAVDEAVRAAIDAGKLPGCVLLVGRHDEVLLRRAYGSRSLLPERTPMTVDTVFDLASLTKPLATATSIMLLVERGAVTLEAPARKYVPELAALPAFTVEQLLLHTSGLPAATPVSDYALGDRAATMRKLAERLQGKLKTAPGEAFLYTDVGYVILEEIVRRASGRDLAAFTRDELWQPLGMTETGFLPGVDLRARAAPTEQREGVWMRGEVHDPRAFALGGVAGHAGLFSTADDLSRYARMMLGRGTFGAKRVLSERTFERFVARHETSSGGRTLGWDRDSRFASHRSALLSPRAFGHGGFTGTAMWIDPGKDLYVVFLSNRVHPDGRGAVNPLVAEVATRVIDALETRAGIDVLRASGFEALKGAHVGLLTNASARARDGKSTIDVLRGAPELTLRAIFSPEHGLLGASEGKIGDATYQGIPVHSLYGERAAPTPASLAGIDCLVVDLQDAGVRFYTYASTMKTIMKIAAERKLRVVVLDRPDPLGGLEVAGPVLDGPRSFVNHHALPVRHGMTMGELARLFAADEHLPVPEVVRLAGWRRRDYFDHTGLVWTAPSPNLRTPEQVVLYPMLGLLEGTSVSVGRGTETPFEVLGAPGLDGEALARKLQVPGLAITPATFTPTTSVHAGKACGGIRLRVTDRALYEPVTAALALAQALHEVSPGWDIEHVGRMLQDDAALQALVLGATPAEIARGWEAPLAAFRAKRAAFLLYP